MRRPVSCAVTLGSLVCITMVLAGCGHDAQPTPEPARFAAVPTTCVKPTTASVTNKQTIDYEACRLDRIEALLAQGASASPSTGTTPAPSPTVPPSASPTVSPAACTKPTASDTGATGTLTAATSKTVAAGQTLRNAVVTGDLTVSGAGAVVSNVRVTGGILVTGDGAQVDHVTATGLAVSSASNVTVRDSQFSGGTDDPLHVTSDRGRLVKNVTLTHNYVHDPASTDTHIDGTQVRGVDGLVLECSRYDGGTWTPNQNAGVYLENANGGDTNVVIRNNWVSGFAWSFMTASTFTSLVGNHYGAAHYGSCRVLTQPTPSQADNINDATGKVETPCS